MVCGLQRLVRMRAKSIYAMSSTDSVRILVDPYVRVKSIIRPDHGQTYVKQSIKILAIQVCD